MFLLDNNTLSHSHVGWLLRQCMRWDKNEYYNPAKWSNPKFVLMLTSCQFSKINPRISREVFHLIIFIISWIVYTGLVGRFIGYRYKSYDKLRYFYFIYRDSCAWMYEKIYELWQYYSNHVKNRLSLSHW